MQRGRIYKHHGSWLLQYYDTEFADGKKTRKRKCVRLAPANGEYPTKKSVESFAVKYLLPANSGQLPSESATRLVDYIQFVYLPAAERRLRPSTVRDYRDIFQQHLKARLGDLRLRDFRTVHGQRIMHGIPDVGHLRLLRIKAVLSAVFTHALQTGVLDGTNPIHPVSVPGKVKKFQGYAYTIDQVEEFFKATSGTARIVLAVAALTGMRLSEIRGLRWSDYDGETLHVQRTVWRTHVGEPKTEVSEGKVPILPVLKRALDKYRDGASDDAYIFSGERRGAPLNLHNLAARVIKPAIEKHKKENPDSQLAQTLVWKGWHAFRRGLASNLYSLGVQPKVIAAILRHSDIGTTLQYYVHTPTDESRQALKKVGELIWVDI